MSPDSDDSVTGDSKDASEQPEQDDEKVDKPKTRRRTKTGCLTCRKRRIKCGEERPICRNCIKSKRECAGYNPILGQEQTSTSGLQTIPPRIDPKIYASQTVFPQHQPVSGYSIFTAHQTGFDRDLLAVKQANSIGPEAYHSNFTGPTFRHDAHQPVPILAPNSWISTPRQSISSQPEMPNHFQTPSMNSLDVSMQSPLHTNTTPQIPGTMWLQSLESNDVVPPSQAGHVFTAPTRYGEHGFIQAPSFATSMHLPMDISYSKFEGRLPDNEDELLENSLDMDSAEEDGNSISPFSHCETGADTSRDLRNGTNKSNRADVSTVKLNSLQRQSPLENERCQSIFRHYLEVSGPYMGIFDRIDGDHPSSSHNLVWTNGLPKLALKHPALAHALLAISALHLSRLHRISQAIAVKHFTYALRCMKNLLGSHETRVHVSTFATILLLAYHEVVGGDHSRWSLHLSGAAKLVTEIDFAGPVRTIRRMRAAAREHIAQRASKVSSNSADILQAAGISPIFLDDDDWEVDPSLVSQFMGVEVDYDHQCQPGQSPDAHACDLSENGAENFKILMEICWWYYKQDLFQSMLSGDAPMLTYWKWKFCPPRGRIGVAEKPYATIDHLWLILARIMDFGFRDRKRKLRVVAANGGEWIPPPGFLPPMPPQFDAMNRSNSCQIPSGQQKTTEPLIFVNQTPPVANEGRARSAKPPGDFGGAKPPPTMYGMFPPAEGPIHMSPSFRAMEAKLQGNILHSPQDQETTEMPDPEQDLQKALKEHTAITAALDKFVTFLGDGFQPLASDQRFTTPFGPALRYKTPPIAAIWTYYHVARIMLRRLHPHSPPAALVSAGVNTLVTADHAQAIGKICGGLYAQHSINVKSSQLDQLLIAALIETTFSLLFAAVQFMDPAQRGWTINKLSSLAQMTGWASSAAIASACEATWSKMGEAGKGPPYQRTLNRDHDDVRFGLGEPTSSIPLTGSSQSSNAVQEHENRFVHHHRTLIDRHTSARTYWAMGLLSVEDDLKAMDLKDSEISKSADEPG